jgi:antimicrobial peptide system SdpA family protein
LKVNRIWEISIWGAWVVLCYLILISHSSKDYRVTHKVKKHISFLLPQGWGFFTRDPREAITMAYKIENGELRELTVQNASVKNYLGFSRNSRFVGIDLSKILEQISSDTWKNGKGDFAQQIPATPDTILVLQERLKFFPEGEYVFYQYQPIPFAWADRNQKVYQPYLSAKVKILYKDS